MVILPPWQCPRSAPAPPQGTPGSSGWLGAPRGEAGPLGAQPLPRVLELAASTATQTDSKVADFDIQVWDLGGQTSIRPYWRCFYQNTNP